MITVKITQPGAHMMAGKELQELKVGQVLELQSEEIPGFLVGKAVLIGDNEGKALVTNDELLESAMEENKLLLDQVKALGDEKNGLTELLDGVRAELKKSGDDLVAAKAEIEKATAEIAELKKSKAGK